MPSDNRWRATRGVDPSLDTFVLVVLLVVVLCAAAVIVMEVAA